MTVEKFLVVDITFITTFESQIQFHFRNEITKILQPTEYGVLYLSARGWIIWTEKIEWKLYDDFLQSKLSMEKNVTWTAISATFSHPSEHTLGQNVRHRTNEWPLEKNFRCRMVKVLTPLGKAKIFSYRDNAPRFLLNLLRRF